ncbi:putative upf0220 domain protein [Golovinomyces cichoracearum]|uniref:Putative upf0220 domain protein n=1 Tax=Golovinomyces cichoracearum TaxID=62708 RepID=A0A420J2K9_9PEZI|nr:putative upf0220 domain protein [Golovinomyces cichoracearum]
MPERRPASNRTESVRRNLFQQQLSRRPTSNAVSGNSTFTESLQLEPDYSTEIVIRDEKGECQIGPVAVPSLMQPLNDEDDNQCEAREEEQVQQCLTDAIKNHKRDRNRTLSDPAGIFVSLIVYFLLVFTEKNTELLEAVKISLKAKVAALADDNWLYEAENELVVR